MSQEKETVELDSLCGLHELTGVDFGDTEGEYEYAGRPNCMWFALDGKTYCAVEDPSDGYRSCLSRIKISDRSIQNSFAAVKVLARKADSREHYHDDILEFLDCANGKSILRVGTGDYDDYYPTFVADFMPQNMAVNAGE